MAHYTILGRDPYWMNFWGLMILTVIEVGAVGLNLSGVADSIGATEKQLTFGILWGIGIPKFCLLYTSPSPRDRTRSRMPSSA